jgi:hypothetical protein
MLTLLAALGCTEPAPTPPQPELTEPELPTSETSASDPQTPDLGPPLALPWPEKQPCKQFQRVMVNSAYLERPDGSLLTATGERQARLIPPEDFVPGLVVRPERSSVHINATCSDSRERVFWSCTEETGCAVELRRIAEPPPLPELLSDLDTASLAKRTPSASQIKRLEPVVRAGIEHSLTMLKACKKQGCSSEETIKALELWGGELPEPTVVEGTPWKLVYTQEDSELQFSCQPHTCTLRSVGAIQTRLDLRENTQSLYVIPGRLDYRDEGKGPRVAISGRLLPLMEAPAD